MPRITDSDVKSSTLRPESRWTVSKETLVGEDHIKWKDLNGVERAEHVVWIAIKLTAILAVIFAFICTLGLLSESFKLIGGKEIGDTIRNARVIQNPISASIIGMVISLLLQSSSTLMSVLVGMTAGGLLTVHRAIPIMMGGEIGASVINALVSLGQVGDRDQFRRAFAGCVINDIYNYLCYGLILPMEILFGVIEKSSELMVEPLSAAKGKSFKTLNALTDPILKRIIQIDNLALTATSTHNNNTNYLRETFIFRCVDLQTKERLPFCPYEHWFANSEWSDLAIGLTLLGISIISLIGCLMGIVKLMQSLLAGQVAVMVRRMMDKQFSYPCEWLTGYLIMIVGCAIVMVVQSSGVFRSALIPLVGIGVINLDKFYPLIIGANVGTTFTAVLAALSADPLKLKETMQLALAQTNYNLMGILLFYIVPCTRCIPIALAMKLGDTVAKYRWFAIIYILTIFIIMPVSLLLLSLLPPTWMVLIVCALVVFFSIIGSINFIQVNWPSVLPTYLHTWSFLPDYMHSLQPYDSFMCHYCGILFPFLKRKFARNGNGNGNGNSVERQEEQLNVRISPPRIKRIPKQTEV